ADPTGLLFYQARYYDPTVRRFVSPDTVVPDPANPQHFDRYSYVTNNPINYSDPSGHCLISGQQIYAGPCGGLGFNPWDYNYLAPGSTNSLFSYREHAFYLYARSDPGVDFVAGAASAVAATARVWEWGPELIGTAVDFGSAVGTADTTRLRGYGQAVVATIKDAVHTVLRGDARERGELAGEFAIGGILAKINKLRKVRNATNAISRNLDDLSTLRGATPDEIRQLVPEGWIELPLKKGEGVRFLNPDRPGEALMVEMGWPNATDPLHAGPYLRVSRDGVVDRIPLAGNPTLEP
ncbi:MAG TPA: RHS repeat-associated core domain-containing protein, partial [Acidimicrobiia bacterium]